MNLTQNLDFSVILKEAMCVCSAMSLSFQLSNYGFFKSEGFATSFFGKFAMCLFNSME